MLSYETALKLKEAGFVFNQKRVFLTRSNHIGGYEKIYAPAKGEMLSADYVLAPTLSELIEACGDIILFKLPLENEWVSDEKDVWVADSVGDYLCAGTNFIDTSLSNSSTGKTPEEAVANLWLELNKK